MLWCQSVKSKHTELLPSNLPDLCQISDRCIDNRGFALENAGPKAERHIEMNPKNNIENKNPGLRAVWGIGNDLKAVLCRLGSAREGLGSFFCALA